jgi:diguanylate cyclase (GGDEF)-like protein
MSARAWAYIGGVLALGALLSGLTLPGWAAVTVQWPTFAALTVLATLAQLYKAEAPNHQTYFATPVFLFAGLLLLHPFPCVLLVVISHLLEWAKERWVRSPLLRKWYLQPFNMAKYVIAGGAAYGACHALDAGRTSLGAPSAMAMVAMAAAALTFVALNQILLGLALVLARGLSWRATGVLDAENLQTELSLVCLGAVVATLWDLNPGLILPALAPLVLMYRALMIPQLKHEAQIDGKTGVSNARHFGTLFTAEFERARRFNRPLAFIMADLDLLRDINNTYGHLAGDTVLTGIGRVIRTTIRDYDVAGRFGGEEFAVVLPEADLLEAQMVAERLRQAVAATRFEVATSAQPLQVTMSLGVACFPADATTPTDLTHAADVAVYQAKASGRNRVVCAADVPRDQGIGGGKIVGPAWYCSPSSSSAESVAASVAVVAHAATTGTTCTTSFADADP